MTFLKNDVILPKPDKRKNGDVIRNAYDRNQPEGEPKC